LQKGFRTPIDFDKATGRGIAAPAWKLKNYVVLELRQANARHGHPGATVEICALMLVCRYVGQAYIGLHRDAVP
jgi:hypothetical protein